MVSTSAATAVSLWGSHFRPPSPPQATDIPLTAPTPSEPAASPRRSKRPVLIAAGLVALGAVAGGIFVTTRSDESESFVIKGTSLLVGEFGEGDVEGSWDDCRGTGGYDDFGPGQNVSVVDAEGTLIGSGKTESLDRTKLRTVVAIDAETSGLGLESRDPAEAEDELLDLLESMADLGAACLVYFEVEVPASDFYTIEIGRRGELDYSLAEMQERNFYVAFSLGG